jgi:hypothetical protein
VRIRGLERERKRQSRKKMKIDGRSVFTIEEELRKRAERARRRRESSNDLQDSLRE